MNAVQNGYKGLALVFNLNWERILYVATILAALYAGAYIGALAFPL